MKTLFLLFILLFANSCSYNEMLISAASPLIDGGVEALFSEADDEFAREAIPGLMKLVDGAILSAPKNQKLLTNATMGFASYAMGYIEDIDPKRARNLYIKAKEYGFRGLRENSTFKKYENASYDDFKAFAMKDFDKDDVPLIFWTAISLGLYINQSMDNPDAIAELSKVEVMMGRVKELEPTYFGGGPDLFFGVIECVKPPMLGGDPEKGLAYFQNAMKISGPDFIFTKAFMVQFYCAATLNEEKFDLWCQEVLDAPLPKDPKNNLQWALAKRKVRNLMAKKSEIF
jgi:hypothetical protein